MRNRVERFFRYLKERTIVFHHKISARDHIQGINNLFTVYYQASRRGGGQKCLFRDYQGFIPKTLVVKGLKEWGRGRLGHPRSIWEALKGEAGR